MITYEQEQAAVNLKNAIEHYLNLGLKIQCSVDILINGEYIKCFGDFVGVNYYPANDGFGSNETMLMFEVDND